MVLGIVLTVITFGLAIKKGAAMIVGGTTLMMVAGIALSAAATLGAVWTVANSIASIREAFCEHGYNFMRDGVLRGNYRLHRVMAWVAMAALLVGGVGLSIGKAKMVKWQKAQSVLLGPRFVGKSKGRIENVTRDITNWLGEDFTVITNRHGDKVFMSKDGLRIFRADLIRSKPHLSPHAHLEYYVGNQLVKSGPIFPWDVPPK